MPRPTPRLLAAIVRHGQYHQLPDTPSAHQPFPLTQEGEQQACQAAGLVRELLHRHRLSLCPEIDSSQLLRAWQTARIMLDDLHDCCSKPLRLDSFDALAERGLGSAANLSTRQIEHIVLEDPRLAELPPDWKSNSHFRLPLQGAESLLQAGERVAGHLSSRMAELADTAGVDTLKLFVAHGAAFRHAAHRLGVLAFEDIRRLSMFHARPVLLEYRADGPWRHFDGEWKVRESKTRFPD